MLSVSYESSIFGEYCLVGIVASVRHPKVTAYDSPVPALAAPTCSLC